MQRAVSISGRSTSTLSNYARCLAKMGLHLNADLLSLDEESILDYLHYLKEQHHTPSESFFKHTIYGLRFLYKLYGKQESRATLPKIRADKKLPVIMSHQQVRQMLSVLKHLRHRLILGLLYGCGLRSHELCGLRLEDVDLDRGMLHVREGKGRKDRYLPLGKMLVRGISAYIESEGPVDYLFNGKSRTGKFSPLTPRGINWAVKEARRLSRQTKPITAHTFRHTYATHILEMGVDIVQVKELLGHAHLETTLMYLHTSRLPSIDYVTPLDKLYEKP